MTIAPYVLACVILVAAPAMAQETPKTPAAQLTRPPVLLEFVPAAYPAQQPPVTHVTEVSLELLVSAEGLVTEARVTHSGGLAFDEAALEAARQFRFSPAEVSEVPTAVKLAYRYTFEPPEPPVTEGEFGGVLLDQDTKQPVADAKIRIVGFREATTDERGRFSFSGVPKGPIQVEVLVAGLDAPLIVQEEIVAGERTVASYHVVLAKETSPEQVADDLEIVVVAPPELNRTVSSTEMDASEAQKLPGTQGDVLKVVESMPGVGRSSAGSGALIVWGAAPADTRTYVGAVRVPTLYHFGGLRSVFHGDLVQSLELIPGGYGAPYGRALGGLVLIEPRAPKSDALHGSIQFDLLDASAVVTAPLGSPSNSFIVSARKSYVAELASLVLDDSRDGYFTIPNYFDGALRLRHTVADGEWLEVGGMISGDTQQRINPSNDPTLRSSERRQLDFGRADLRYERHDPEGAVTAVSLWYGHDFAARRLRASGVQLYDQARSQLVGLRIDRRQALASWLDARVGLDFELVYTQSERSGVLASPAREGDPYVFARPPADELVYDAWSSVALSAAPYGELDVAPFGELLHLVLGVRVEPYFQTVNRRRPSQGNAPDIATLTEDILAEPRLTVEFAPARELSFQLSGGLYRQPAIAGDLSAVFGNPMLRASRGTQVLGGASYRIRSMSVEGVAFYTRGWDRASRNPSSTPLVAEALVQEGQSRNFGGQLMVRKERTALPLYGWVSYTIMRGERRDSGDPEYRLSDTDQTHVLTAIASYALGWGLEVGLRARYATGFPRVSVVGSYYDASSGRHEPIVGEQNSTRVPDFFQLDARVSKDFDFATSSLQFYLDVQNVTNRSNPEELAFSPDFSEQRYVMGIPILPLLGARWEY